MHILLYLYCICVVLATVSVCVHGVVNRVVIRDAFSESDSIWMTLCIFIMVLAGLLFFILCPVINSIYVVSTLRIEIK